MSDALWVACALVLVFEGILPFLSPTVWRQVFERALKMSDGQIRFIGLSFNSYHLPTRGKRCLDERIELWRNCRRTSTTQGVEA